MFKVIQFSMLIRLFSSFTHFDFYTSCGLWRLFPLSVRTTASAPMRWYSLLPQWQSRRSARIRFPGELRVAGDDQRDRGEVGLPLQPWKPWHILWGTDTLTVDVFCKWSHNNCYIVCFYSVTALVWSLCGDLSVSAVRRPVWNGWEYILPTPAFTTNGTCLSTFSYGECYLTALYFLHTFTCRQQFWEISVQHAFWKNVWISRDKM